MNESLTAVQSKLFQLGTSATANGLCIIGQDHPVWLIESGNVDVFLMAVGADGNHGLRTHVFSAGADQLLIFPVTPPSGTDVLVAIPAPDARFRVLSRAELLGMFDDPCEAAFLYPMFDTLISNLWSPMGRPATTDYVLAQAGRTYASGARWLSVSVDDAGIWGTVHAGQASYCGQAGPIDPHTMPLPPAGWVTLAPNSELRVFLTGEGGTSGRDMLEGLDTLLLLRFDLAVQQRQQNEEDELDRLQLAREIRSKTMSNALGRFVSLFGQREHYGGNIDSSDHLLNACKIIGVRIGVDFKPPPTINAAAPSRTPVQDIAYASGVRVRAVALKGEWWRNDNGPLLVFEAVGHIPHAILPKRGGGYTVIDPVTGVAAPFTTQLADALSPFACHFYAGLPAKKLRGADILRFVVRGIRHDLVTVAAIGLASALLGMALPVASAHLFDSVFPAADHSQMMQVVVVLFISGLAGLLLEVTRALAMLRIEGKASSDLQAAVWDRVLSLPVPFFRLYTAGDLATRINGINEIRQIFSGAAVTTLLSGLFSVLNVVLLFYYSVKLALIAVLLMAIAIAVNMAIGYLCAKVTRATAEVNGKAAGLVLEYVSGIAKLRITGAESRAFANWAADFSEQKRLALHSGRLFNASSTFNAAFPLLSNAVIFSFVASAMLRSWDIHLSTGEFIGFSAAWTIALGAVLSLVHTGIDMLSISATYDRTRPILEATPETERRRPHPGVLNGEIELCNVSFAYGPDAPLAVNDVSLHIKAGEFIALVGESGSGKSTLLRLMLGFEEPDNGAIYFDGKDLAEVDVGALRRQLGVVLQGGRLMGGDIYSNVIGATALSMDDALDAVRACGLADDIAAMPMGMHTAVGDGGGTLSGGQRQRILIARAIIHRPRIIFFDEATSALDNRSQRVVGASMEKLRATRVVIAHRLSTIINADRIYVLDKGKIVQCGSYRQLMEESGLFADLAKRQIA